MPRVVHFEIPSDDPDRSIAFYSEVFGWKFTRWEGPMEYWLVETGDNSKMGIDGGMMRREAPDQPLTNVIDVTDIDAACQSIEASGGQVVVPKMPVPGIGWVAYFTDPDGHFLGVIQPDMAAA